MWHIDTTVIRLLDGTRAYLHAVIDNFSRRILAWRVAETFAPVSSVAVLLDASRAATPSDTVPRQYRVQAKRIDVGMAADHAMREAARRSDRRCDPSRGVGASRLVARDPCPAPLVGRTGAFESALSPI